MLYIYIPRCSKASAFRRNFKRAATAKLAKINKLKKDLVGVVAPWNFYIGGNAILNWPGIKFQQMVDRLFCVKTGFTTRIFQNNKIFFGSPRVRVSNNCLKEFPP